MIHNLTDAEKAALAAGTLCYICSTCEPLLGLDEFGGHSCQQCRNDLAAMRVRYALADGSTISSRFGRN